MLISPQVSKHVVYITLSSYVASFLKYVYRADKTDNIIYLPEDFPYASPRLRLLHDALYKALTNGLCEFDVFASRMAPNKSYCEWGYRYATSEKVKDLFSQLEKKPMPNFIPENIDTLQPFALPDVYFSDTWHRTTPFVCLGPKISSQFRSIAKLLFWVSLAWHIDNIYNPDIFPTQAKAIEDFLLRYNIDLAEFDTISRIYRRERTACTRIANNLFDAIDPVRPIFFLKDS